MTNPVKINNVPNSFPEKEYFHKFYIGHFESFQVKSEELYLNDYLFYFWSNFICEISSIINR